MSSNNPYPDMAGRIVARHLTIFGRVQGVGYRAWSEGTALKLGLRGWVRNRRDGTVEALIIGEPKAIEDFIRAARHGPAHAEVRSIEQTDAADDGSPGFRAVQTL